MLDVVRRIVDTTGVDIELASAVSPAAAARRDNLDLFVKAVAEFQAVDGDVTLPALLAYLTAEDDQGNGLDVATPTEADSVKLLTVHRAKGLEWDSVFLVGVCETRFPSNRVAHAVDVVAARCCRRRCAATPRDQPAAGRPRQGRRSTPTARDTRAHERQRGAPARLRRLHPRRATGCAVIVLPLEPAADAVRPLATTRRGARAARRRGASGDRWLDKPEKGDAQPLRRRRTPTGPGR